MQADYTGSTTEHPKSCKRLSKGRDVTFVVCTQKALDGLGFKAAGNVGCGLLLVRLWDAGYYDYRSSV